MAKRPQEVQKGATRQDRGKNEDRQKSKEPERADARLRQRHRRECGDLVRRGQGAQGKRRGDEAGGQDQIGAKWGQGRQDQRRGRVGGRGRRQDRAWAGSTNQSSRRPGKQTKGTGTRRASFLSRSLFFLPFCSFAGCLAFTFYSFFLFSASFVFTGLSRFFSCCIPCRLLCSSLIGVFALAMQWCGARSRRIEPNRPP